MALQKIKNGDLRVGRGEHVQWVSVVHKGWRIPKVITIILAGQGAQFEWFIAVSGHDDHSFPLDIRVIHKAPSTVSRISARSVLDGRSHISWNGRVIVEKGAHGVDTHLAFRTLLLSASARARTIPSLEIATDDVTAGHAASVDRLADDALFYCASRGLDHEETKKLLAHAFLSTDAPASLLSLLKPYDN